MKVRFDYLMSEETGGEQTFQIRKLFSARESMVVAEETAFYFIALQTKKVMRQDPRRVKQIPIITLVSIADQLANSLDQEAGQFLNIYTTNWSPDFYC